ncbi:hypothetical protein [Glutamicibacter nicotianae]|uniref:hypothetical protein n=1 Tax=Glutamicibacter nicotianae TaxID=37929 RepID=UPI000EF8EABF|nr:hypothetical protein [Glutamicibacter nicotianae]
MTPLEILEAHTVKRPWSEASRMRCKCGEVVIAETEGQLYSLHRAHLAEVLDKHMQEREAGAVRETSRYLQRIFPRKGLVNRADILADIEIAADRLGRGIHANGGEKETPNGR